MNLLLNFLLLSLFGLIKTDLLSKCRLQNPSPYGTGIGFPRVKNRVNSVGILNVSVLFVDFNDNPANRTTQDIFSIISPTSEAFFFKSSYGRLQVKLRPYFKWLRMSKRSIDYNMSPSISYTAQKAYISEASSLAKGWDFSTSQLIVVMTNPYVYAVPYGPTFNANLGGGFTVNGKVFENAVSSGKDLLYWKGYWLNHEMSHAMGLPDLYEYASGSQFKFTGGWSIMGNINGLGREYFGWERWLLGWIQDSQIICGTFTIHSYLRVTLTAIEIPNGLKLIVVPIAENKAVVIESRKKYGFDDKITKPGLLVYLVDSSSRGGTGPIKVLPLNLNDNNKMNATMSVGSEFNYENIKIFYQSSSSTTDDVIVFKH
ncbi:peptidase M6 [Brachionus plicatilis]|uniref:Peptidase M6 n=1 Tax=Brachionus plicatilis TaxID=10195 RepID=A0A3M7SMN0_BRAPC|nr:peptidase M6 [Brachionus plicatilis]